MIDIKMDIINSVAMKMAADPDGFLNNFINNENLGDDLLHYLHSMAIFRDTEISPTYTLGVMHGFVTGLIMYQEQLKRNEIKDLEELSKR